MKKFLVAAATLSLLGVVAPIASAGATAPVSLTGLSAAQVVAVTDAAALAKGSVTRSVIADILGNSVTSLTVSLLRSGIQHGSVKGHKVEAIFVNGVVYVKLDAVEAKAYFGASVTGVANKWISFTKGHTGFATFDQGLTLPGLLKIIAPSGTLSVTGPTSIDGQSVLAVSGNLYGATSSIQGTQTLYVSTTAPFLPVSVVVLSALSGSNKPFETISFKNWGVQPTITRPAVFTPSWKTKIGA